MNVNEMTIDQIEIRMAEIETELDAEGANVEELKKEVDGLVERKEAIIKEADEKRALKEKVASASITPIAKVQEERKVNETIEVRNTPAYVEAYANYIKTGKDAECRALLTENTTNGTVPVPEFVYDIVKTAWEREGIMALVKKAYVKGNLKVGFEISGTDAIVHTEGGAAIDPETLVLGVVEMIPQSIKKVVQISDEVYDLRGEAFLRYIYDELTYKIAKKAADQLIAAIIACGTQSTTTCVGVPALSKTGVSVGLVAEAMGNLTDEAPNPVVMMNKATWSAFKSAQYGAGYAVDPFEGLPVVFNNTIKSVTAATTGETFLIVGDLAEGALANFPNGEGISFKFDELSLKKQDLIEVFGRQFVAVAPVRPNAFCQVKKAA